MPTSDLALEPDIQDDAKPQLPSRQFAIADIFLLISIIAIALAITTPFLRCLAREQQIAVIVQLGIQFVTTVIVTARANAKRRWLLGNCGSLNACGTVLGLGARVFFPMYAGQAANQRS